MPSRSGSGRTAAIAAGLLAAGLSGFVYSEYRRDIRQARSRISKDSRIALTPCGPIEYAAAGDGTPVLLVHGAGGGYDQTLPFGSALVDRGFRIVAPSRFGYLRTPLPSDASAAAQADAHVCLLDALGIERASIIAVSAGAPSALQFALRHPDRCRAMVLLVPAAYAPRAGGAPSLHTPAWAELIFDTALRSDFLFWAAIRVARATLIRSILATPLSVVQNASADEQARVDEILGNILPVSPRRRGLLNDAAVIRSLPRYELERIEAPTLVIGVADCLFGTFEPARYTAEHIPGARFTAYETGGHLWVGHHRAVVSEVVAFLSRGTSEQSPATQGP